MTLELGLIITWRLPAFSALLLCLLAGARHYEGDLTWI